MKHIIFVIHTLAVGGAERRISALADYTARKGHKVTILLIDNPVVDFAVNPEVRVVCVNQNPQTDRYDSEKCELFKTEKAVKTSLADNLRLRRARRKSSEDHDFAETELFLKYKYALPLYEYLKQFPEAVIVSFMTIPNISLMMAAQGLKNRVLFSDCNDMTQEYPEGSPFNALREKYYSRADAAIFQTPVERDFYTFLPDTPKYVVPNLLKSD